MSDIVYRQYVGESDLPHIMALVQSELSEPYVIYTFRYFLHQWLVHVSPIVQMIIVFIGRVQASSRLSREQISLHDTQE